MKNNGLFSSLFIEELKGTVSLDDAARGRMATLTHTWRVHEVLTGETVWDSFLKQAVSYLEFVSPAKADEAGVYPLFEDWSYKDCISVLYLVPPKEEIDLPEVGRFHPAKLLFHLEKRKLTWGILTNGNQWRLYSTKSSRPYEDYIELELALTLEKTDEGEYGLFERFFHKDSFVAREKNNDAPDFYTCRLDRDRGQSEEVLESKVKKPFLAQVDEVLQYICNGFIFDTRKPGEEYTEEERREIFESAVKLIYRSLFLFYAEARRLLPSDPEKAELYRRHSIRAICEQARKFRWGERRDTDQYDLWKHLKGLTNAVNDGDPEYGIMGYNGGLFDDEEECFLRDHQLRNDFLARALYLLSFVEPYDNEKAHEYAIPYEDLEVRHLGELYENILEYTVMLADADRIRRRTKKGVEIVLASGTQKQPGDTLIKKGEVYFGESALERKQTGSYYTPESLVRFLNEKSIVAPLREVFEQKYRTRLDQFLKEAREGIDPGTQRGAAESAAALIGRFAEEEVLCFAVCDPAMGSGHFLVDAANQMAAVVISLLAEVPYIEGMSSGFSNSPNVWRRLIIRRCIYGVDLNPLAVNLARLSLWLNCFASVHKLTFLDHHLRCGNSLIGILGLDQLHQIPKRKKDRKKDEGSWLFDVDDLSASLAEAAGDLAAISEMNEDDTDRQRETLEEAEGLLSRVRPLADLYTAYLMNPGIPVDEYRQLFELLAMGEEVSSSFNLGLPQTLKTVQDHQAWHHFFHWPLEFPDVFGPEAVGGFNATVGNPPWDIVKPNSQEFFSHYDPKFRSYKKQEANKASAKLMADNPAVARRWQEYGSGFTEQSAYFKEPAAYGALGKGDINTFKLFLERFFVMLRTDGRMGIVVPSGIYTDQGCQPLREMFFESSAIDFLYCFENRRAVFNIHRSFKFVLFGARKGGKTDRFKCAFMEHDPERLPVIDDGALQMSVAQVRKFSPDTLSVMEFKSQRDIDTAFTIYKEFPLIGNGHRISVAREFDLTGDSQLLSTKNNDGPVLYEGKMVWVFDCDFRSARFWIKNDSYYTYYVKDSINRACEFEPLGRQQIADRVSNGKVELAPERYRLAFREVAADTNERTFVSAILPIPSPHSYTLRTFELYHPRIVDQRIEIVNDFETHSLFFWLGVCNSFVFDYVARIKTTNHLSTTYMHLPLPRFENSRMNWMITFHSARLTCVDMRFAQLWSNLFKDFKIPHDSLLSSVAQYEYGPAHEQEIRKRLRDEAPTLTTEWGPHCGVHDLLPDRRDTGDRAQLRAEIDAYVAYLYGLSRDDFAYILDTFPVLKKKEIKAFGEFMSKRKCLEEYDRVGRIVDA